MKNLNTTNANKKEDYENMSVDELVKIKKQKYGNIDISEPMSDDEKLLTKIIAKKFSDINSEIRDRRKRARNDY